APRHAGTHASGVLVRGVMKPVRGVRTQAVLRFSGMNHQAFDILEFPSLRALVRRNAQTEPDRTLIDQLEPVDDIERLQHDLTRLREMIVLLTRGIRFSFDGIVVTSEPILLYRIEGNASSPYVQLVL